jgi:hypothetical protein
VINDPELRKHSERLRRTLRKVEALLGQTETTLDALTSQAPDDAGVARLDRLRAQLEDVVRDYLNQNAAFLEYSRERVRKIEETNRRAAMAEQRSGPARDQARIQELSEELTRDLRLGRVDAAIKELLDFLSDPDFFAANASTGRRRRLRSLQNAIAKALEK